MKKLCLFLLLFMITGQCLYAQIISVMLLMGTPRLYEKTEWDINLTEKWKNPYLQEDIALDMLITTPSGKKLSLPCFYASGSSGTPSAWKARFAPQETGKYSCVFQLSKAGKPVNLSKAIKFLVKTSDKNGFLHLKNNWVFQFDDGKPFRGIGEDIAWESRAHDDSRFFKDLNENPKYNYEYMLPSLAAHGGNFFRTWICPWNLPLDWKIVLNSNRYANTTGYYNYSAIQKMDRLIDLSDSLGLYIMLTLGPGAYTVSAGGFATSAADFFVNPNAIARYKNKLRYIIARWGYSTSIGAWELFNEIDNTMYANKNNPIDPAIIVKWHEEMSAYIKKTDPYGHLVTTSISHRDLPGLNSLEHIDFNQKHIYRNTKSIPSTIIQYEKDFKKPYVIGEFAYEWDWSKDFNLFAAEMDSDFKRGLWYGLFSPTPVLPMSWWWEYFNRRGTDAYIARVRTILNQMLAAGNGSFEPVVVTASLPGITMFGVQCGNKIFAYAFNPADAPKTTGITLTVTANSSLRSSVYNCESGVYSKLNNTIRSGNKLQIPGFKLAAGEDVVFVISLLPG